MQQHEVNAAADALLAERARPTVERVRGKLGRGSPNTVAPMLEVWFAGLAPRLGIVATEEDTLPAPVMEAMQALWAAAQKAAADAAQKELADIREKLDQQGAALAADRAEATRQVEAAGVREALMVENARDLGRELDTVRAGLAAANAVLSQREQALEEARGSIATLVQQKDANQRNHAKAAEALARERDRLQERTRERELRLLAEVDRARQDAKVAAKALTVAETRFAKACSDWERAQEAADKKRQELELANTALRERLASAEQRAREFKALATANKQPGSRTRKTIKTTVSDV